IKRPSFEGYYAPGYSVITRKNSIDEGAVYRCYFKVDSPAKNLEGTLAKYGITDETDLNNELLMLEGAIKNNSLKRTLISMGTIICALIFAGSVSLIYSAFAISVSERTKQFGILSSVGATKKQLRSSVLYEAFVLALIAVPIGIAAGLLGTGLTLHFLKDIVAQTATNSMDGVTLRLSVSPAALLVSAVISIVTVLVSAWIPSKRAMRVSPLEAIRQTRDVAAKGKQPRRSKLFLKLFGAEGMLSKNYYHCSKKKYRATVFSLVMSLVLFITASAFTMYLKKSVSVSELVGDGSNFDLLYNYEMNVSEFDTVKSALEPFTDDACAIITAPGETFFIADDGTITTEYAEAAESNRPSDPAIFRPNAHVYYIDDAYFEKLVSELGLDMSAFTDEANRTALVVNVARSVEYTQLGSIDKISRFGVFKDGADSFLIANCADYYKAGQHTEVRWSGGEYGSGELIAISYQDGKDGENGSTEARQVPLDFERVRIGALLDNAPLGLKRYMDMRSGIQIAFPLSTYPGEYGEQKAAVCMRSADSRIAAKQFKEVLVERGIAFNPSSLYDAHENNRVIDNLLTILNVFTYGFIVLITLISAANVFNTITTNVALRRRDYAMLRSMGMTKRGMNRMMNYECLLYGSKALIIGLPIAIFITFNIDLAVGNMTVLPFELPWTAIGIAVIGIFIVVFASMLYQTGRIKKDNPIEALRNENI
ncbi:MAG: ABC transporter permease, partial [Clostridia bacterium]|nr:ABC transporter permease [Clostridia bacterium]